MEVIVRDKHDRLEAREYITMNFVRSLYEYVTGANRQSVALKNDINTSNIHDCETHQIEELNSTTNGASEVHTQRSAPSDFECSSSIRIGKNAFEQQYVGHTIMGFDTMKNGDVIAAVWEKNIIIIDIEMKLVKTIPVRYEPYGVCMIENNDVCVSFQYQYEIHISTINGGGMETKRMIQVGKVCRGLLLKNDKIYLACGQGNNAELRVYSKGGDFIKAYDKDTSGQNMFHTPFSVTTNNDGSHILVADRNNGVIALSVDGMMLWTYSDTRSVNCMWGIAVDENGDVYISGYLSNNVVMISKDGRQAEEVLKDIDYPRDICYDAIYKRLIVISNVYTMLVYPVFKSKQHRDYIICIPV